MEDRVKCITQAHRNVIPCALIRSLHHRHLLGWPGNTCPQWSCDGCLASPPCVSMEGSVTSWSTLSSSSLAQMGGWQVRVPSVLPSTLLKNGYNISLLPVTGDFTWQPWISKHHGQQLGNSQQPVPSRLYLRTLGCISSDPIHLHMTKFLKRTLIWSPSYSDFPPLL